MKKFFVSLLLILLPIFVFAKTLPDSSLIKFVGVNQSFSDPKYSPSDLVSVAGKYLISPKKALVRKEAKTALENLANDFYKQFKVKISVVSGYRSYDYQVKIKKGGCSDTFCAKPGHSEHQTGLAVDLFATTTQKEFLANKKYKSYFLWLTENAHKYGFHNSYQKGKDVDGYEPEPWHWRYLGINLATTLHEKNLTFTEYNQTK